MASRRGWYVLGVVLASAAVLGAAATRQLPLQGRSEPLRPESTPTTASTAVRTTLAQRGAIAQALSYTGDVKAKAQVTLVPKVAGRIESLMVDVGDKVQAGQQIALLEHDMLDAQVEQARAGVALARARLASLEQGPRAETVGQAEANVRLAEARMAALKAGPRAETVGQAEANVRLAEARMAALKAGPTRAQVDAAEAALRAAKNQLYAVQAQADAYLGMRGSGYTSDMKEAQAGAAYEHVKQAEAQMAALTAPPTQEHVDQAEAALEAARQQLLLAQNPYTDNDLGQAEAAVEAVRQQLLLAKNPYTDQDLAASRAALSQAEAGLRLATLQQDNAAVKAPISGVVSERFVSQGDMASPTAPMLQILGEGTEVQIAVEEAMIPLVTAGKPVSITVTAYPGMTLPGKVLSVAPSLDPRTRTSVVKIQVEDGQSRLKPGMFAQASIVTASRETAILVPKTAVVERNQRQLVFVAQEGAAAMKEVRTGLTDGKSVEVVSGLKDGDRVIVSGLADIADGDPIRAEGPGQ